MCASSVLIPERARFRSLETPLAPPAVEVEETSSAVPVVRKFAMIEEALPEVEGAVVEEVPFDIVKLPSVSTVSPATVEAELLSNPEVIVTAPEIVGVAVQDVPVTVRSPPSVVRLLPETVKVPATSSLDPGPVVPMPTLPVLVST